MSYRIILSQTTFEKIIAYRDQLAAGTKTPGKRLAAVLNDLGTSISDITAEEFIEALLNSKKPQIYAEHYSFDDGRWNKDEFSLLGDISVSVPVTVFDDGTWSQPTVHEPPIQGTLLFTPGALLRNQQSPDRDAILVEGSIDQNKFNAFYENKLLPLLIAANKQANQNKTQAVITVPGIGCGNFAGEEKMQIEARNALQYCLAKLIHEHSQILSHITCVYFNPCAALKYRHAQAINHIRFIATDATDETQKNFSQLCPPKQFCGEHKYGEPELFSLVAWDHLSWPGNDFYLGFRTTDDGVKAAATDCMLQMTDVKGEYDAINYKYLPPRWASTWNEVINHKKIKLSVVGKIDIISPDGGDHHELLYQDALNKYKNVCEKYLAHLQETPANSFWFDKEITDQKVDVLKSALEIFNHAENIASHTFQERIDQFKTLIMTHREVLSTHRDNGYLKFVKGLGVLAAGILGLGVGGYVAYQHFFGAKSTHGARDLVGLQVFRGLQVK